MKTLVVGSIGAGAGKTSLIAGWIRARGLRAGYLKPLGDRLSYRKKRLWDADVALLGELLDLALPPEELTLGFEPLKLGRSQTPEALDGRLREMAAAAGAGRELLLVEASRDLLRGAGVGLDPVGLARRLDAPLLLIADATDPEVLVDGVAYAARHAGDVRLTGVVATRVRDAEAFEASCRPLLAAPLLGAIPEDPALRRSSVERLVRATFARVLAGEAALATAQVGVVLAATMSAEAASRHRAWGRPETLLVASGDRPELLVAALERPPGAILLTDNLTPPPHVAATADALGLPLLLVPYGLLEVTRMLADTEPLTEPGDAARLDRLAAQVSAHVQLDALSA